MSSGSDEKLLSQTRYCTNLGKFSSTCCFTVGRYFPVLLRDFYLFFSQISCIEQCGTIIIIEVFPKWRRTFIEFGEFSEFRESEKSLKNKLGSI